MRTKYFKSIFAAMSVSLLLMFTGCDSLDLGPIDNYGSTNYWKNVAQVQAYVNGIHSGLRANSFNRSFILGEARGGLQVTGTSTQGVSTYNDPIKNNTINVDNPGMGSWAGMYGNIFDCNLLIQNVEGSAMQTSNQKDVDYILAQTYGIRALYYFTLYRAYGGVPLITKVKVLEGKVSQKDLYTARSSAKDVMTFIKSDIDKSLAYYTSSGKSWTNNVTWSKAATQMLAAEVYLWSAKVSLDNQTPDGGDLAKAEGFLNEVKGNAQFGLLDDFASIFASNNEGNKEIIFAINFADGESTSATHMFLYADANIVSFYDIEGKKLGDNLNLKGTALQRYEYTPVFWKTFLAKDKRRGATFMEYYDKDGAMKGTVMKKFIGSINSTGARVYDSNEPFYRYADVLLMLAEVENMKGGDPAQYINQIRKRAYSKDYDATVDAYTNSDFKTNEYAILTERDREFVCEGKRWYDVCRMKDAANGKPLAFDAASTYAGTSVLKSDEAFRLLWPVDKGTLNADPELKQTPGY